MTTWWRRLLSRDGNPHSVVTHYRIHDQAVLFDKCFIFYFQEPSEVAFIVQNVVGQSEDESCVSPSPFDGKLSTEGNLTSTRPINKVGAKLVSTFRRGMSSGAVYLGKQQPQRNFLSKLTWIP